MKGNLVRSQRDRFRKVIESLLVFEEKRRLPTPDPGLQKPPEEPCTADSGDSHTQPDRLTFEDIDRGLDLRTHIGREHISIRSISFSPFENLRSHAM